MTRTLAAGAVVQDERGRVLLVLRAYDPEAGAWTIPGGHVEPGESLQQAARREVFEETGLDVTVGAELGVVEIPHGDATIEAHDFAATVAGGRLAAGDDAADVGWFSLDQLRGMRLTVDLLEAFDAYGVRVAESTDEAVPKPRTAASPPVVSD